jgi:hypothetical protein
MLKEIYTKFSKKEFIKMWRTMKAETGSRQTHIVSGVDEKSISGIMNRYEERTISVRVNNCSKLYTQEEIDIKIKKFSDALESVGNILYVDQDGIGNLEEARSIIQEALKDGE